MGKNGKTNPGKMNSDCFFRKNKCQENKRNNKEIERTETLVIQFWTGFRMFNSYVKQKGITSEHE